MNASRKIPLIGWEDLTLALKLIVCFCVSVLVPARWDGWAIKGLGVLLGVFRRKKIPSLAQEMRNRLGSVLAEDEIWRQARLVYQRRAEAFWARVRGLWPGRWQPEIQLRGQQHLHAALAGGRGAIVWFMSFCDSSVLFRAMLEAGQAVTHLGRDSHGAPSRSQFGILVTAKLFRRSEDAYLDERIMFSNPASPGYVRRLRTVLAANRCLTIRGDQVASSASPVRFLGQPARLATGAPVFAWTTGARLLTAHVVRKGVFRYEVVVEPVALDPASDRTSFVEDAVKIFVARLEEQVRRNPADWDGWSNDGVLARTGRAGNSLRTRP